MAAGQLLAGFVKGASGQMLDDREKRQAAEAEMRKLEMLERLRKETEKEMAVFREELPTAQLARRATEEGLDLNRRRADMDDRKFALDEESTRQQMRLREADQVRQERYTNASIANMGRSGGGGKKLDDNDDVLMAEYNNTFRELKEAGASPAVLANFQTRWYEGVNTRGWGKKSQREFLLSMRRSFTQPWKNNEGETRRPILEATSNANALLEARLGN